MDWPDPSTSLHSAVLRFASLRTNGWRDAECVSLCSGRSRRARGLAWPDPSTPLCSVLLCSGRTGGPASVSLHSAPSTRLRMLGGGGGDAELAVVGLARSFDFATLRCAPFRFAQDERGGGAECVSLRLGRTGRGRRVRFASLSPFDAAQDARRGRGDAGLAWVGLALSFDFAALRCAPFRFAWALRRGSGCSDRGGEVGAQQLRR